MKTRVLIITGMIVFTLSIVDTVYGLSEDINPEINNINENSL